MDGAADLLALLPEVQEALSEEFDGVDCSISPGPVLSQLPFRQPFRHLGRNVVYVPDVTVSCMEDIDSTTLSRLNLSKNSAVFTDGQAGSCLELALGRGRDWKTPLTKLFDRLFPGKWAFFIAELEQSNPTFHVLCCGQPPVTSTREDTPDSTEQNSQVSSPTESVCESSSTNFSLWIVPVTRIFAIPPPKKVKIVKKIVKKKTSPAPEGAEGTPAQPTEKKRVVRKVSGQTGTKSLKKDPKEEEKERENSKTPDILTSSSSVSTLVGGSSASKLSEKLEKLDSAGTSKEDNDSATELRKKLEACEEKFQVNGEKLPLNGLRNSSSLTRMTPDRRLDPIYEGAGKKERCVSPSKTIQQQVVCRVTGPQSTPPPQDGPPFLVLQLVLSNNFNYQQLGQLRLVHPHWDEIAGQLLNSGYYQLLERCDKLLMALQRRLPSEPHLSYVTSVLTSIQVHVLNPVDIMRACLDEGVCCFPYGVILDKTFILLDQIEFAMQCGGDQPMFNWEALALLSKKAALHYRTRLEKTMEDRLGENLRLKAAQRILRLDSFMVESNVAKLEKDQLKVKDDLKWELEQVQTQNAQLRKDNRQLKQDHLKLEARVDILEQKFRTLARLLS